MAGGAVRAPAGSMGWLDGGFMHVCKLPPEANKMVPSVTGCRAGPHFRDSRSIWRIYFSESGSTQWEFAEDQFSIG